MYQAEIFPCRQVRSGIFNGKGHSITSSVPFVKIIGESAAVKLLIYKTTGNVSGELLCKTNNGTVDSCSVYGNAKVGCLDTALLCCANNGSILNSSIVGSIYGSTEDSRLSLSEAVYINNGIINNVYSSVKVTGHAGGRYTSFVPKAFAYENNGTVKNCFYNSTENNLTSTLATPVAADELKSAAFIKKLNESNPSLLSDWVADTNSINGGYPIITENEKIEETVSMSYNSSEIFTYHAASFSTKFNLSSNRSCTIYYTTDGTDPRFSSTRETYSKYSVTISGDKTVKSVAYYNGTYGRICTQKAISLPGAGTEASPYKINSSLGLYAVRSEPDKFYSLETDLDFSNGKYINDVGTEIDGWIPIPDFSGTFDGKSHSITGISGTNGGMFNKNSGTVENLRLVNHKLCNKSSGTFGSIANYNSGKILRCYSSIDPDDTPYSYSTGFVIGGIVGSNSSGTISYCYSTGNLRMSSSVGYSHNYIGGIAGAYGTIKSSYSDVNIITPSSNHDLGCVVGGIGGQSSVASDCRFDGSITPNTWDAYVGFGSASFPYNETRSTVRCFCGGSYLHHSGKTHLNNGDDSYISKGLYSDFLESSFSEFDFDDTWMITSKGPMPQGIMNADGTCLYKSSYTEPTCNADGKTIYKDQYGNLSTEVLEKIPHALNEGVCTRTGCNYKEVYKIDLKYNNEIITSQFEAGKNGTYQFTAEITPKDVTDNTLTWTSSDEGVATVTQKGKVSAVGEGNCVITVTASNNVAAELNIKVTETPYLNKIKVSDGTVIVGGNISKTVVFATDKDTNFLYCVLTYPADMILKNIKAVDFAIVEKEDEYTENGYTTLILNCLYSETENIIKYRTLTPFELTFDVMKNAAPKTVKVEVTDDSCLIGNDAYKFETRLSGDVEIYPKLAEKVEITGESSISSPAQYTAHVTPDYTSDKSVIWTIDKENIATIDENGIVTPVTSGTVIITATAADKSGVYDTKSVEIVKYAESIEIVGESEITAKTQYSVVILPDYTTDKNVKWAVSDESVATVDENGIVTPLKNGKIVLTVTATDASGISTTKSIVVSVNVRANSIVTDIGVWDKEFDPDITDYIIYVPQNTTDVYFTSRFENATAKINGSITSNGLRKKVTLNAEQNTIELVLTPTSANTLKGSTYTFNVVKFEGTKTTVSEDGTAITVTPVNICSGVAVILALYNGNTFVGIEAPQTYSGKELFFETSKKYTSAKVMVWSDLLNMTPICEAEIVK